MKSLTKFVLASIGVCLALSLPAHAQGTCPKGRELVNTLINSINAIPGDPNKTKAYAIIYWKRATYQVYENVNLLGVLNGCSYPKGNCGLPDDLSGTRFQQLVDYQDAVYAFRNGKTSSEPRVPMSAPFPDDGMLEWAEGVLGCTTSEPAPAAPPQTAPDPKWVGYDAARQAGGDQFYQWWRKNFEMRRTADAFELCRTFGSSSYECSLVAEWTYLNSGRNPYTGGTTQTFNGTYSDQDRGYNAGYEGTVPKPTYTPPTSNEPRCYDQGDGTEKCFYD